MFLGRGGRLLVLGVVVVVLVVFVVGLKGEMILRVCGRWCTFLFGGYAWKIWEIAFRVLIFGVSMFRELGDE